MFHTRLNNSANRPTQISWFITFLFLRDTNQLRVTPRNAHAQWKLTIIFILDPIINKEQAKTKVD